MIFKIINNKAYKVSLAPSLTEEEYSEKYLKSNEMLFNDDEVPDFPFLKLEDGKLIKDESSLNKLKQEYHISTLRSKAFDLLSRTDYLMLFDNPAGFNDNELHDIKSFRVELRALINKLDDNITQDKEMGEIALPALPESLLGKKSFVNFRDINKQEAL